MSTRNVIIERLFTGKNFNDCLQKMEPAHLRDDLKMEVALVVCEWPDEKVVGLHKRGELDYFVVRVILNQIQSKTSPFFKKYRRICETYIEDTTNSFLGNGEGATIDRHYANISAQVNLADKQVEDQGERLIREQLEDYTLVEINNLYWYDAALIRLYLKHGTFRAIQDATKIPYISCYKNIQKSLETLRMKASMYEGNPVMERNELKYKPCRERK